MQQPHDKDHPWNFTATFPDRAAWERRAEFVRHQALVALGLWPEPEKTPLNAVIHGRIDRDGYTVEKVFFASLPGHYVSGNLYRPKGRSGKRPAVLCPYGHWPDGRFIWRSDAEVKKELDSGAEEDPLAARTPLQMNYATLARMGCVVFTYDMVGYCDSTKIPHREGFLDAEAMLRLQSFMGLQTWNSIRSLDFVLSLPDVDPQRIAVTGSSSGGTQTIALCATDARPAVSFPMVMISMNMQGGCVCENAPLYRVGTNNVELACLFAPKPEGAAAANDWTSDFLTRGLPEMKSIWALYGAQDEVDGHKVQFSHNHNLHSRLLQYAFLNKHLKLGCPEPLSEAKFQPVPPKELSVYDNDHPRPADETDAAGVRKWMTETAQQQLAAMSPEQYASTVRIALEAMVVDQFPGGCGVNPSSEDSSHQTVFPRQWNGTIVIWVSRRGAEAVQHLDAAGQRVLDSGAALLAIDAQAIGAVQPTPATAATKPNSNPPYAGFVSGYERTVLANRVHELLTQLAAARRIPGVKSVRMIATDDGGVPALLARTLAGDAIERAAIDLNQFDFDQVRDPFDPMLLPGALKYGGIYGFVPLIARGSTLICNARTTGSFARAAAVPGVELRREALTEEAMVLWLLK